MGLEELAFVQATFQKAEVNAHARTCICVYVAMIIFKRSYRHTHTNTNTDEDRLKASCYDHEEIEKKCHVCVSGRELFIVPIICSAFVIKKNVESFTHFFTDMFFFFNMLDILAFRQIYLSRLLGKATGVVSYWFLHSFESNGYQFFLLFSPYFEGKYP